jgi:4-aminobutyrate aminotransferase-like enzyme
MGTEGKQGGLASVAAVLERRQRLLGANLRLSYRDPLHIVRGSMQYLWDVDGRRYLDGYNNVPHVGHCHPRVVQAGQEQMARLNTNTRYLHELTTAYAERLGATLPGSLKVCYFVNSGSEANELALRLARAHTGRRDLIVLEHAYHGNTTTLIDVSPYKHCGPGGSGTPPWVHVAPLPDLYRDAGQTGGPENGAGAGTRYVRELEAIIDRVRTGGGGLCGFMAESWPSVAGQLRLPADYVQAAYARVRAAGGVCIADEVQTGYGRLGGHFWGFEYYHVVPDIVVLGKPIGNGHPIGAVVTTAEIARSFDNGMEFFSTFGGNTVSCAIGLAVLDVVQSEALQRRASEVGAGLLALLRRLQQRHELIGDVRGAGLFVGVELVTDRASRAPASAQASDAVNRMRELGVLVGTEGPHHNVIKIRPPLPFDAQDAARLSDALASALRPDS